MKILRVFLHSPPPFEIESFHNIIEYSLVNAQNDSFVNTKNEIVKIIFFGGSKVRDWYRLRQRFRLEILYYEQK